MKTVLVCSLVAVAGLFSGCVSRSEYQQRVAEVGVLKGTVASLEERLARAEEAGKAIEADLRQHQDKLAKLQEEHEALKTASLAASGTFGHELAAVGAKKEAFAAELDQLAATIAVDESRIKELTTTLPRQEEVSPAAIAERDQRIKGLEETIRTQGARIEQLKEELAELSRKRSASEEKERASAKVRSDLHEEITQGKVALSESRDKMIVTLPEQVLFASGSSAITPGGRRVLDRMVPILKKVKDNQIRVEGHTDNIAIGHKVAARYPTNWDLAAARAIAVVKYLQQKGKVDPRLLALAGYGPYQPAAPNSSAEGRKLNRRIEIALVPMEPQERKPGE